MFYSLGHWVGAYPPPVHEYLQCFKSLSTGQIPGPGSMMPGQPMPGRMIPAVAANIHPTGSGPTPPGMPPMPGNILGPRVPLTAPNGMCK
jgi:SWI/SNF related-matrix-associated actin-dependent regulator of chromatin subfamily C